MRGSDISEIKKDYSVPDYLKAIEQQRFKRISKQKKQNKHNIFNKKRDGGGSSVVGSENWILSDFGSDTQSIDVQSDTSLGVFQKPRF